MSVALLQSLRTTAMYQLKAGPSTDLPDKGFLTDDAIVSNTESPVTGKFPHGFWTYHGRERKKALLSICGISPGSHNLDTQELRSEDAPLGSEVGCINYP